MAIYVNKGPIVIPSGGGEVYTTLSIDGNRFKNGKRVSFNDIRVQSDWLTVLYDEEQYDNDGYYYGFVLTAEETNRTIERYNIIYFDYELEDGTTKTESITVYQEGYNSWVVLEDGENPLLFNTENRSYTVSFKYTGSNSQSDINTPIFSSNFYVEGVAGGVSGGNFYGDYDITEVKYNVTNKDIYDTVKFSYINPTTSTQFEYRVHLNQQACYYPFGLTKSDGSAVPEEKYMAQPAYKRWRDISFNANSVQLRCFYPYAKEGSIEVTLNNFTEDNIATLSTNGGSLPVEYGENGVEELYTIRFSENYSSYTRRVDLTVTYQTTDGTYYTDTVQLYQNASDGSNINTIEIKTNVGLMRFEYDGTPSMYDSFDVTWLGEFVEKNVEPYDNWIHIGSPVLIEDNGTYNKTYRYSITVDKNTDTENTRNSEVVAYGIGLNNDDDAAARINIVQAKAPDKEPIITPEIPVEGDEYIGPIWKDVEFGFGLSDVVEYSIYKVENNEDTLIFTGRSNRKPSENENTILVNKICQNYFNMPLLPNLDTLTTKGNYEVFKLTTKEGTYVYRTFKFVNDWSYTDDFKTGVLSHPILNDNTIYRGQRLPFSVFAAAENVTTTCGVKYKDGATDRYGIPLEDVIWSDTVKNNIMTINFPYPAAYENLSEIKSYVINDVEYPMSSCGAEYVLYYLNPWGGYDWFPIKGKVVESDSLTQYHYTQNYNNTTWGFGKKRYLSEINKKFQLNTHWLKEDESKRMWYLLESNTVYLHNLKTNEIHPVLITNTEVEYKQRGITSNRISYQIEVELSQTRERL